MYICLSGLPFCHSTISTTTGHTLQHHHIPKFAHGMVSTTSCITEWIYNWLPHHV
jgi:hypothetical protein